MGGPGQRPPPRTNLPPVVRVVDDRPPACPRCHLDVWARRACRYPRAVAESPRLPWRLVALSTLVALGAATGTYVVLADDDDASPPPSTVALTPEGDLPDADEVTFTTFDGEEVALATLRGSPTVVNFFASYCTPCVEEMPALEAVHQQLGDDVAFVGLAVVDRPEDAQDLVDRTGVTYRTALDRDSAVMTALGGSVLPTTVLLDADGEVVATHNGELDADELRRLLADELGITS
jgi:cytochrome c biogenesis protein CcmG, thiol:disulfide interchange protein DsbE